MVLGSALRSERAQVVIATKGGYQFHQRNVVERVGRRVLGPVVRRRHRGTSDAGSASSAYTVQDFSAAHIRRAVDDSLRRLRTDYIDLYQFHGPRAVCGPDVLSLMDELIRVGKVRRFGVGVEHLDNAAAWVRVRNISSLQVPFGPLDTQARDSVFEPADRAGLRIVCRGVLGSGLLNVTALLPTDPNAQKLNLVRKMSQLAVGAGVSVHQLALWWTLADRRVNTVLIGMNSPEHVRSTVRMAATPCEDSRLLERLEELILDHQRITTR
jgi:aryl-alcohol dehydrogenase-like predicted oxidoreductase